MMQIGAQLYTVREFCRTPAQLAETLKKVADMGYRTVQLSGVCAYDPAWMKDQLAANGLRCVLTHTAANRLRQETAAVAAEHEVFGCRCVGLGSFPFRADVPEGQLTDYLRLYRPVAETLRAHGKYFMHHNHDQEFQQDNGAVILQRLAEAFPPELLGFTLDTFWVQAGGGDPAAWLERLSGRVPCIHVKDFAYGRKFAVIGEGNLNFERIFEKAEQAGTEYLLVEQDDCYGEDPFECLRRSCRNLQSFGFR